MGYRLLHWGPLIALSVIGAITSSTVACHLEWWPLKTYGAFANAFVFALWNVLTLYNFFKAAFVGPGYVPLGWKPAMEEDVQYLQYCITCRSYKAPRSHHCRKCRRCVMKMDHHCPWINNCVGHFNHANFTAFLFFAPCGCIHSLFIIIPALYRAINRTYYLFYGTGHEPLVNLGVVALIGSMVSVGLAIGVIIAVGGLFIIQMRSIVKNETGIESWIKEKAECRDKDENEPDFIYPYYLGRWRNLRLVLHWRRRPELDGIWWPVRPDCNQYTITMEQLEQKKEKRHRSVLYEVTQVFNGALCPLSFGFRVFCCPPCMDEQRLKLHVGNRVLVSRFRKHWLYGDLLPTSDCDSLVERRHGWFPRRCANRVARRDLPFNGESQDSLSKHFAHELDNGHENKKED